MSDLACPVCGKAEVSTGALRLHVLSMHDDHTAVLDESEPVAPRPPAPPPPNRGISLRTAAVVVVVAAVLGGVGAWALANSSRSDPEATATVTSTAPSTKVLLTTTTSAPPEPTATAAPPPSPTTAPPAFVVGQTCALGSHYDCIDPDGDGTGTYLHGGGDCMRDLAGITELCEDLDGDGWAGYPDHG